MWHLGDSEGRYPTDQGFDEWYGIPNSSDESFWPQQTYFDPTMAHLEHVMEGRRGEKSRDVKVYDAEARREIDLEVTAKTIDFMKRSVQAGKPFFAYVPLTQVHLPTEPSKQFAGKTGNGDWADVLAQMDWCVGQILDAVAELKIQDNTLFVFTSDNGPEDTYPWRGWAGPWSGSYSTAMEASLRVPFIVRWPGKIPAGRVSNEIVHVVDMYTTLARVAGAEIPTDRAVDGVDQTAFVLGKQEYSAREWFPVFLGTDLYAMKWRNWKMHLIWQERMGDAPQKLAFPRLFNLYITPQERPDESLPRGFRHGWVAQAMFKDHGTKLPRPCRRSGVIASAAKQSLPYVFDSCEIASSSPTPRNDRFLDFRSWVLSQSPKSLAPFQESLKKYPPIPMGTADPYVMQVK